MNILRVMTGILLLYQASLIAYPTTCSVVMGCDSCIECRCLNGHRFTTLGNHSDAVGNNLWSDKVCADNYGIAADWTFSPLSPGVSQPWRTIWGTSCPTYRTFTNKTDHEVLIQFLNISAAKRSADGNYSVNQKVNIDSSGIHGLNEINPLMILEAGMAQRINYSHADIVHIVLVINDAKSCVEAGKCARADDCAGCVLEGWKFASSLINEKLNFEIVMPTKNTVDIVAASKQEPLL